MLTALIPPQIKLIAIGFFLLSLIGTSAYLTHKIDESRYVALELKYKEAEAQAVQQALDLEHKRQLLKDQQALEASKKQQQLVKQTQARLDEVQKTINDNKYNCIDYGTIRLFNRTVESDPAKRMPIAPREPDAKCSTLRASDFARTIIKDLGIAKQNAQQLNDLIQSIKELKESH